jgi:hypothetical protein
MNSLLALLLLLTPSACSAVPQEPQDPLAYFVQDGMVASASGSEDGYTQLTVDGDDGQLLLVRHGGRFTALLDGEVLPGERVVRDGDKLTVRDVDGSALYEIRVVPGSNALVYPYDAKAYTVAQGSAFPALGAYYSAMGQAYAGPAGKRKLIGITTAAVDGALRAQLGLEGEAFLVETVNEDMPADKGGVEAFDVVTAIDGEEGASTERLREVLDAKEPGETLTLTVLRQGETHELELTVEEPREMGVRRFDPSQADAFAGGTTMWRDGSADAASLREMLTTRSVSDAEREKLADELARVEAEVAAVTERDGTSAARRLAELAAQQSQLAARKAELEAESAMRDAEMALLRAGSGGDRWLMLPSKASDAAATEAQTERLALLEERLARLEELLERLAARGAVAAPGEAPLPAKQPAGDDQP